jgi:hypothetical protein
LVVERDYCFVAGIGRGRKELVAQVQFCHVHAFVVNYKAVDTGQRKQKKHNFHDENVTK